MEGWGVEIFLVFLSGKLCLVRSSDIRCLANEESYFAHRRPVFSNDGECRWYADEVSNASQAVSSCGSSLGAQDDVGTAAT